MLQTARRLGCGAVVLVVILAVAGMAVAQRGKLAVFVQASAPVPAADLEILKGFAYQQAAVVTGAEVSSPGEVMRAQRLTNTYVGNSVTFEGTRRLAQTLDADHLVIFRVVRWESQISFKPERSLLMLGATSVVDSGLGVLITPLGILFGLDKEATVGLFVMVLSPAGDVEFTTSVTCVDRPLLSLLTADPLEAAKQAIEAALYQLAVAL